MLTYPFRRIVLIVLLGSLPDIAAAVGTQAGDNGRQPIGADNDSPRQAIPNASSNDGSLYDYDSRGYYAAPYGRTYGESPYYVPRYYNGYYVGQPRYYVPPQYYTPPSPYYYAPPYYYVPPYYSYDVPRYYGPAYYDYSGSAYYDSGAGYSLLACDREPLPMRRACRDAIIGRY